MHPPSGETLTLTPAQEERAKNLLSRTLEGDIQSPTDVVDSWDNPNSSIDRDQKEDTLPQYEGFVTPSAIAGPLGSPSWFKLHSIKGVLACMIEGDFEVRNMAPPSLQKRGDRFYVTNDGHHRSMVARAIGLDELYAHYTIVPPEHLE